MLKKKLVIPITILTVVIMLVGCKNWPLTAKPLISSSVEYSAYEVATAIGPDGIKHYVWSECNSDSRCHIVYAKTYLGEIHPYLYYEPYQPNPEYEPQFRFPDIAVGGDGYVYLVWHYIQDEDIFYDCWQMIAPDDTDPATYCALLQDTPDIHSTHYCHPQVVAMDNTAYAVYGEANETGEFLYYIKLRMYDDIHGRVSSISPGLGSDQPQAALSSYQDGPTKKYILHVLWASLDGGWSSTTYYNDNYGVTGNMNAPTSDGLIAPRSHPVLAVDNESGNLIGQFFIHTPADDHNLNTVYCPTQDCKNHMTWKSNVLDSSQDWAHEGTLGMAMIGDTIYFSFTATTAAIRAIGGFNQIFVGTYQAGDTSATGITQITNKSVDKSSPKTACLDFGTGGCVYVTGWREKVGSGYYKDAYIYVQSIYPYTQLVFSRQFSSYGGTFDMSARDTWITGIWNSPVLFESDRSIPWYSMNVESSKYPLILKP
jgi:hypothetical protein